jgi:phosphohistidine swiveling domain-containing protein
MRIDVSPDDPLHQSSGPGMAWTLANSGEALPGVLTPLTWTLWQESLNLGIRRAYYNLGAYSARQLQPSAEPLENFGSIFFGRFTATLELHKQVAGLIPGMSPGRYESAILGGKGDDQQASGRLSQSRRRYHVIAYRAPVSAALAAKRLHRLLAASDVRWRRAVAVHQQWDEHEAVRQFLAAGAAFQAILAQQSLVTLLGGLFSRQAAELARRAGSPEKAQDLISGGELQELGLMGDLWDVARGRHALDRFLADHGYHGPREGCLDAVVWRADPRPVESRLAALRTLPDDQDPRLLLARQQDRAQQAEREVVRALPARSRPAAFQIIRLARHFVPLREVGKAAFLRNIDIARMAVDPRARAMIRSGLIADAGDAHYLTAAEFAAPAPRPDLRQVIEFRRDRRKIYESLDVPESWVGDPVPVPAQLPGSSDPGSGHTRTSGTLSGIGVGTAVVSGVARVVTDPAVDDVEPGEILICRTTDPSWIPLLQLAAAVVTDIGSGQSHSAIIAREIGLPCVVNTKGATRQIRTGDMVEVDPGTGTVRVTPSIAREGINVG